MSKPTVSMIGTVFVDVKGVSHGAVKKDARNLGKVIYSHGGSARNAAENMAVMGLNCKFVSTVDNSGTGDEVRSKLKMSGVNVDYVKSCPNGMGMWIAVLDSKGDLAASISQLPDLQQLEDYIDEKIEEIVQMSDGIALDTGLTIALVEKVVSASQRQGKPVYGVAGNLEIVLHNPEILRGMDCFVCNKEEAELLLQEKIQSVDEALQAVVKLARFGSLSFVLTLDAGGSVYYDSRTGEHGHVPTEKIQIVDSTGAGDAFFSGLVYELVQGRGIRQAAVTGTRVALQVIQSMDNSLREPLAVGVVA